MLSTLVLVSAFAAVSHCANILAIIPAPFYSHQIAFQEIWKELSRRGHHVTLVTTVPIKDPTLVNLTQIDMSKSYRLLIEKYTISKTAENILNMWNWYDVFAQINRDAAEEQLSSSQVQELIHHPENYKFDVLFVESYFPEFLAFSKIYNCPSILVTSVDGHTEFHHSQGNPAHPILNADYATPYHVELNFMERVISVLYSVYVRYFEVFHVNAAKQKIVDKYFPNTTTTIDELINNVDMLFLDCNPAIQGARAIGPTTINFGMERPLVSKAPLSEDIRKFLDLSVQGVIYMSLGSNVRSSDLNKDTLNNIIQTFREIPYNVLWKFETEDNEMLQAMPKNVKVVKWVNQQLVLKHPNIKLFITQGGLQSLEEATYSYVPLVVIPYFADQFKNARLIEFNEIGKKVGRKPFVKKEELKAAVLEVITNPKYKKNIHQRGIWAADVPMSGLDKAVWWTEYVIRHKGAKQLRNSAADIPLYQYLLLDVIAFIILISVCGAKFIYFTLKKCHYILMTSSIPISKKME